jgi:hypothetical protein
VPPLSDVNTRLQREPGARIDLVLVVILALCIVRLWIMPLPSSFWVDEMASVFVAHRGAGDPSLRVAPQVADSLYYQLPSAAERMFGSSEVSFRLTSVAAMLCALIVISKIGSGLIHPQAGWLAVFGCMAMRDFNFQAADARPYAIGTLVMSSATLMLIQWLDSGRMRDAIVFAIFAAALWWTHLVLWPFYAVFLLYGATRIRREVLDVSAFQIGCVVAVVLAGSVLVAVRAVSLLHDASSHVIAPQPSMGDLSSQLKLGMLTGAFALFACLNHRLRWVPEAGLVDRSSLVLVLAWWLVDARSRCTFLEGDRYKPVCWAVHGSRGPRHGSGRLRDNSDVHPRETLAADRGVLWLRSVVVRRTVESNLAAAP